MGYVCKRPHQPHPNETNKRGFTFGLAFYRKDVKRCMICDVYLAVGEDELFCDCCGVRLRGRPRSNKCRRSKTAAVPRIE